MDLELERTQMSGFMGRMNTTLRQEETLEMIVPDACPDILRVVETDGTVLLGRKEAGEGRVQVSGTVRAGVLYQPEGEGGLRRLDVNIPFLCAAEGESFTAGCAVVAEARLCHADTRAMNPRKVLVRADIAVDVSVFSPEEWSFTAGATGTAGEEIEQLKEEAELYVTTCIREKPAHIEETVTLSSGKPAAAELLKSRVTLNRGDAKIIGNKLIFKGTADVSFLYRGEDNGLYTSGAELPFSQIMEVSGSTEEADCDLVMSVAQEEFLLRSEGEGRQISVNMDVLTQAVIRESRVVTMLTDAYSVKRPIECEWMEPECEERLDRGVRSQNVREIWEAPVSLREITDCHAVVGQVVTSREGENIILTAQAEIRALALDEQGEAVAIQRSMTVPCALELGEGCICRCRCEPVGEVYATPASGGLEVRFTLDYRYVATAGKKLTVVSSLRPGTAEEEEEEKPSLVLRMPEKGERLWDVAKAYGTTIADIVSANELEGEAGAAGKLLLIPRRR